ncbi:hypothetical protein [Oenococcus oeni]|nr:hypothetical protein [Oenococcus oeni]
MTEQNNIKITDHSIIFHGNSVLKSGTVDASHIKIINQGDK